MNYKEQLDAIAALFANICESYGEPVDVVLGRGVGAKEFIAVGYNGWEYSEDFYDNPALRDVRYNFVIDVVCELKDADKRALEIVDEILAAVWNAKMNDCELIPTNVERQSGEHETMARYTIKIYNQSMEAR